MCIALRILAINRSEMRVIMKFEKINDNQIKCTLNKSDLASRKINLSEFAYGTPKAKQLFQDMLQQAATELGFVAENTPIMIEAIPVSAESIVIIITKVEDPEELDTRFSHFSPDPDEFPDSFSDGYQDNSLIEDNVLKLIPSDSSEEDHEDLVFTFKFKNIDDVCEAGKALSGSYHGLNSLYKEKNDYYLVVHSSGHTRDFFNKVCNTISEYGYMTNGYIPSRNMGQKILIAKDDAIQKLANI